MLGCLCDSNIKLRNWKIRVCLFNVEIISPTLSFELKCEGRQCLKRKCFNTYMKYNRHSTQTHDLLQNSCAGFLSSISITFHNPSMYHPCWWLYRSPIRDIGHSTGHSKHLFAGATSFISRVLKGMPSSHVTASWHMIELLSPSHPMAWSLCLKTSIDSREFQRKND